MFNKQACMVSHELIMGNIHEDLGAEAKQWGSGGEVPATGDNRDLEGVHGFCNF